MNLNVFFYNFSLEFHLISSPRSYNLKSFWVFEFWLYDYIIYKIDFIYVFHTISKFWKEAASIPVTYIRQLYTIWSARYQRHNYEQNSTDS